MIYITEKLNEYLVETIKSNNQNEDENVQFEFELRFDILESNKDEKDHKFVNRILGDIFSIKDYTFEKKRENKSTDEHVKIISFLDYQKEQNYTENKPKFRIRIHDNGNETEFIKKESHNDFHYRHPEPRKYISNYYSDIHKYVDGVIFWLAENSQIFRNSPTYFTLQNKIKTAKEKENPLKIEKERKLNISILFHLNNLINEKKSISNPYEVLSTNDLIQYILDNNQILESLEKKGIEPSDIKNIVEMFKSNVDKNMDKLYNFKKYLEHGSKTIKSLFTENNQLASIDSKIKGVQEHLFYYNTELLKLFEDDLGQIKEKTYENIIYEKLNQKNVKKYELENKIISYSFSFPGKHNMFAVDKMFIDHPFMKMNISKETKLNPNNKAEYDDIMKQKPTPKVRIIKRIDNWELSLTHTLMKKGNYTSHKYMLEIEYIYNIKNKLNKDLDDLYKILFNNKSISNYYVSQVCNHLRLKKSPCIGSYRKKNIFPINENFNYQKHHVMYEDEIEYNKPHDLCYDNNKESKFDNFHHIYNNPYAITDKADGLRRLLVTTANGLVFLTDGKFKFFKDSNNKKQMVASSEFTDLHSTLPGIILDGEYIEKTKTFYAFDILYYNFEDITNKSMFERHYYMSVALEHIPMEVLSIDVMYTITSKTFYYPIEYKLKYDNFGNSMEYPKSNEKYKDLVFQYTDKNIFEKSNDIWNSGNKSYKLDGTIFSPIENTYNGDFEYENCNKIYKKGKKFLPHLKWKEYPSIDVQLKKDDNDNYKFYGSIKNDMVNVTDNEISTYINGSELKNKKFPIDFETNDEKDIIQNNDIVELIYKKEWIPISIRRSKDKPNSINVIHSIYHTIKTGYNNLKNLGDVYIKKNKKEFLFSEFPIVFDIIEINDKECILYANEKIQISSNDKKLCGYDSIIGLVHYENGKFVFDKIINNKVTRNDREKYKGNSEKLYQFVSEGVIQKEQKEQEQKKNQYDETMGIKTAEIGAMKYNNYTKNVVYSMALELINKNKDKNKKSDKFLLEYASGKGGDLASWYNNGNGFTHVLAIDNSRDSIYEKGGLKDRYENGKWDKEKFKVVYIHGDITKPLKECGSDESENKKIKNFFEQKEFDGKFHLISCQFAIHYINDLNEFIHKNVIPYMMSKIGMFIYTYVNIKTIENQLRSKDVLFKYRKSDDTYQDFYKISKQSEKLLINNIKWGMNNKPIEENVFNTEKIKNIINGNDTNVNVMEMDSKYYNDDFVPKCFIKYKELDTNEINEKHGDKTTFVTNSMEFMKLTKFGILYKNDGTMKENKLNKIVGNVYEKSLVHFPQCNKKQNKKKDSDDDKDEEIEDVKVEDVKIEVEEEKKVEKVEINDEYIITKLHEILEKSNIKELIPKKIREQLEKVLEIKLDDKKEFITDEIKKWMKRKK